MAGTLKFMCVFPHPDDETLGIGGTLAKLAAEGVETYSLCATRGERGWQGPGENPGLPALGRIREAELRAAANVLGMSEVAFLDYIDGDLDKADPLEIIEHIVSHLRRVRPQVVMTFSPDGNYGHPDHIALSQFTGAALMCAADASFSDLESQPPHRVSKFYYLVDSASVVDYLRELIGGIGMEVDGVFRGHIGWEDWMITTRIDTFAYVPIVKKAIVCHQTQLPSLGSLMDAPDEVFERIWGKGVFYRAFSLVNGGRRVETDLFEGLR